MPVYEFRCPEGHSHEVRTSRDISTINCRKCNKPAERVPIYKSQYVICETGPKVALRNRS